MLIYRNNAYQRSVVFSSANTVVGRIVSISGNIISYFNLKEENGSLIEKNGQLEMELLRTQNQLELLKADTVVFRGFSPDSVESFPYDFVTAKVIYNSVNYLSNYITIDKGVRDGISVDMGVVSERGVVGIISSVSDHMAVVIPILNPKLKLSGKVKGSGYFGSMSWDGRDVLYANLDQLPRHVEFQEGDTIVTSGFSAIFPAGIIVGTVSSFERQRDDNFFSLKVRLATDFRRLNNVRVVNNYQKSEKDELEEGVRENE